MRSRSFALPAFLLALVAPAAAFAQDPGDQAPEIDVVEVVGVVDAPIARYLRERIADAEARQIDLLVLEVDSVGMLKADTAGSDERIPDLAARIRDASVPIAVHVGPLGAQAGGGVAAMLAAAHVASMGPSTILDLTDGFELAEAEPMSRDELAELEKLATSRGRSIEGSLEPIRITATEAEALGLIDRVDASVHEMLVAIDGTTETVAGGTATLDVPSDLTTVRFWQPGPFRRVLHALVTPAFAYLLLLAAIMLFVFESSMPGFGVAGGTAAVLAVGAVYAFTVLPATPWALAALLVGSVLLWLDVVRDELLWPTWIGLTGFAAGSLFLLPKASEATALPTWIAIAGTAMAFLFFAPIMTLVKRQRRPIATQVRRRLVGETGDVRSMLNPEGYVMVTGELYRARLAEGGRLRVGERVTITGVDGAVLLVSGTDTSAN